MKLNLNKILILLYISAPALIAQTAGRSQVLEGNKLFTEEKYDEANNAYRDAQLDNPTSPVIDYNIANTLHEKKKYEEAIELFNKVTKNSDDPLFQSQAYYNLANTLYRLNKLQEAIPAYTEALKLNPDDEDAKYNLEFVRAKLKQHSEKQEQDQQQKQEQPKPSDYAKKLKERAEKLATEFKYSEAHELMTKGLKVDKTVAAFQQFIDRLGTISEIDAL
ncbi:MAG: tetratricopeptide repeat protein [Calditrichaeota bacterium]|nr:MAG: tetratricopeptide repeat protein [Calditrichota bacterium]